MSKQLEPGVVRWIENTNPHPAADKGYWAVWLREEGTGDWIAGQLTEEAFKDIVDRGERNADDMPPLQRPEPARKGCFDWLFKWGK